MALAIRFEGLIRDGEVESYAAEGLGKLARRERSGGLGDLVFDDVVTRHGKAMVMHPRGFLAVQRVRDVEAILRASLLA